MTDREESIALNRRLLARLQQRDTDQAARAIKVPAECYLSSSRYAAEVQQLFRNTPQPVAFSAELPEAGDYLAIDLLDLPVLLVRDSSGERVGYAASLAFFRRTHSGGGLHASAGARHSWIARSVRAAGNGTEVELSISFWFV